MSRIAIACKVTTSIALRHQEARAHRRSPLEWASVSSPWIDRRLVTLGIRVVPRTGRDADISLFGWRGTANAAGQHAAIVGRLVRFGGDAPVDRDGDGHKVP